MPQGVSPTWLGGKWGGLSSPLSLEREIGQRPTLTDAHPPWDLAAAFQIHPATLLNYARAKCCHALLLLWVLDKCFSPNPSFYSPLAFPFPFAPVPYTLFSCCFIFCFFTLSPLPFSPVLLFFLQMWTSLLIPRDQQPCVSWLALRSCLPVLVHSLPCGTPTGLPELQSNSTHPLGWFSDNWDYSL